jgi:hypothetical protein
MFGESFAFNLIEGRDGIGSKSSTEHRGVIHFGLI